MPEQVTTSFIPKKPEERETRRSPAGVLSIIAMLVFVVALLGAGGVFLYGKFLDGSIVRKQESLERAREAFEPALIEELARLDARMMSVDMLLGRHRAFSNLFAALEELTLQNVRFSELSYAETPSGHLVAMVGEAGSFNALALQADVLGKSPQLHDVIFSDFSVNERGAVDFNVSATLDPSLLVYVPRQSVSPPPEAEAAPEDVSAVPESAPEEIPSEAPSQ